MAIWEGVKVIHKPALLKDELLLLFFGFWDDYTTIFPFDFIRIVYKQRCVVFNNYVSQRSEIYNLWIVVIQGYTLHYTFIFTFPCIRSKDHKYIVFRVTRYEVLNEGAKAKLLQLICEVAQINPCLNFWGFVYILNVYYRVCIEVQYRLPQFPQLLVQFKTSLGRYAGSNCHVNVFPRRHVILRIFPKTHVTSSFGNVRFVTSIHERVKSS